MKLKEEKESEIKTLLARCQEVEKEKAQSDRTEGSGDKTKIKQLNTESKKLNVSS